MNLSKMFEMQRALDQRIIEEKGLQGQDWMEDKLLALQVEVAECANEWRGFKRWSNNQKPRTKAVRMPTMNEEDKEYYNPLLEEYVDGLHFLISSSIYHDENSDKCFYGMSAGRVTALLDKEIFQYETITKQFNYLFLEVGLLADYYGDNEQCNSSIDAEVLFENIWKMFIGLGKMLGFTWEEIRQAYFEKNQVNHQRQSEGY